MNKTNILLIIIGIMIGIMAIYIILFVPRRICTFEESTEKWIVDSVRDFPLDSEIMCEDGVEIEKYLSLNEKTIYDCLSLVNNKCSGFGKTCLIKTKKKICEIR